MTEATEVLLLRWADNQNGRTVTFLLPDEPGDHPFKGEKCGSESGQRYGMALARIADDETVEPKSTSPKKRLTPSQRAALLCSEVAFQGWIRKRGGFIGGTAPPVELVANRLRSICKVDSRSEFDTDSNARSMFEALETEYLQSVGRMARER